MTEPADSAVGARADAITAACMIAVDPVGLGGIRLRARSGPWRDAWFVLAQALMPSSTVWHRLPPHTPEDQLLGGLDLTATLASGRAVMRHSASLVIAAWRAAWLGRAPGNGTHVSRTWVEVGCPSMPSAKSRTWASLRLPS